MIYKFEGSNGKTYWTTARDRADALSVAKFFGGTEVRPTSEWPRLTAATRARVIGRRDVRVQGRRDYPTR